VLTLATSVVGHRLRDKFQIWTGNGANEKGFTITIMAKTFGWCYYEPGQTLFYNRWVTGTCLSNEMAKLADKRVCMTSETEAASDNKLRVGLLKQCNGYDLIRARGLWCTASEFRYVTNIIMMFN